MDIKARNYLLTRVNEEAIKAQGQAMVAICGSDEEHTATIKRMHEMFLKDKTTKSIIKKCAIEAKPYHTGYHNARNPYFTVRINNESTEQVQNEMNEWWKKYSSAFIAEQEDASRRYKKVFDAIDVVRCKAKDAIMLGKVDIDMLKDVISELNATIARYMR